MRHLALRGFTSEEVAMLLKLQKDPNLANLVMDTILLSNFDEPVSLLQEKDIKPIKISGFYRDIFKYECESYHINLPDNILDGITLLSHFPETASTFFKQSACKVPDENTPDIKSMLNDIHADFFNIINSLSANLSFWIVFLKYLPHFRTQLQIWELIVFITHLSTQVKNETIDSISHISSSLPVNEIKSRKRSLTYLLQWSKDLSKVDSSSNTSKNDLKEAFFNSSVLDLVMLQRHFSVVEPLCRTPLTPEDIHLIYLMESYLTRDEKELLFDSLTPELFPSYIL